MFWKLFFYHIPKDHLVLENKYLHWHGLELSNRRKNRDFWLIIMYRITGNNCNNMSQTRHHLCLNIFFNLQMYYVIGTSVCNWLICISYKIMNIFMIVKMINLRMRWVGHVAHMGEKKNVDRVLVGKPGGVRPFGWPRHEREMDRFIQLRIGISGELLHTL